MEDAVCDYGSDFHQIFIEEAIVYIFNILTNKKITTRSEYHDFYYKMIYYYDIIGIIIWANTLKGELLKKYINYIDVEDTKQQINKNNKTQLTHLHKPKIRQT